MVKNCLSENLFFVAILGSLDNFGPSVIKTKNPKSKLSTGLWSGDHGQKDWLMETSYANII